MGSAELRNGNPGEAITWCEKSLAHDRLPYRDTQARFILAISYFHTKDIEKARRAWDEGERIFQENNDPTAWFKNQDWHDWMICRFIRQEARGLLQPGGEPQSPRRTPAKRQR